MVRMKVLLANGLKSISPAEKRGCLPRVSLPLLLLLFFLGLVFVLLVATQVQGAVSWTSSSQKQIQALVGLEQEEFRQLKASMAGLCRPCPWEWYFFQGNCYSFSMTLQNWKEAASACKDDGAQLAIIDSAMEQNFLRYWDVRKNQRTWIGLSDHHIEGSWRWVDGTPLQLSFWMRGEPNNAEDEDCVELVDDGWNDNRCTAQNFWLCERPAASCPGP
ncbi:CD209 antigen [Tenrec ecaudatus]|uniref:CD209 antigen n=1 Tax=Tenrec ecaudatus TaxID=94439 RepID=UPI003F5A9B60